METKKFNENGKSLQEVLEDLISIYYEELTQKLVQN